MDIDFSSIVSSDIYKEDKKSLTTTGNRRAIHIWLILISFMTIIAWPILIYLAIKTFKKGQKQNTERKVSLDEFCRINNYTFVDYRMKFIQPDVSHDSINLPFDVISVIPVKKLEGTLLGYKFTYSMVSVQLKGDAHYPFNIFTINLPVDLPKLYIDSKANNLKGLNPSAVNFEDRTDHNLEGDFYKYYTIRAEKNEHINMYTILTPEVMDRLKHNNSFDIWLSERQLKLITFADEARYYAGIPLVFENAYALMKEIDNISRSLRIKPI